MKAEDNEFPSLLFKEGTAPSSPAAGDQRLFVDSADHKLKRKNSSGTVTSIEAAASLALDDLTDVATAGESAGKVLTYNGSSWVPTTPSGGGSSTGGNLFLAATYI